MSEEEKKGREFRRLIGLNLALLGLSGVIPCGIGFAGRNALACVSFACLTVYGVSYAYQFATSVTDLAAALESFAMILPIVGGQLRFAILLRSRDDCRTMLNVCARLWSGLKSREKKIVQRYAGTAKFLTRCYSISCVCTVFFYAVLASRGRPIFDQASNASAGSLPVSSVERRLPYAFFLEVEETPWYEIAYVFQLLAMLDVGFTCIAVDTAGPLLILIACGLLDVTGSRIEDLGSIERSAEIEERLRECVKLHRTLLEFCDDIERLTNGLFLVQLFASTYHVSLVGFKLVGDDPDKGKHATPLLIGMMQLFLCNWPPDLLLAKGEDIGRVAYSVPWHRYPDRLRKPTGLLMVRGQKSIRLTAGKLVGLSLETFASMISTAASFFAVVRNASG